jgi:uncharacterized membrane protein YtjA (UPF0391 family)
VSLEQGCELEHGSDGSGWHFANATRAAQREDRTMLRLAVVFLVICLIAALLGYGGISGLAWEGARIFFFIFLVLAVLTFVVGWNRRRSFWG